MQEIAKLYVDYRDRPTLTMLRLNIKMMENTTNVVECGWKKYSYTSEIIMWARKKNIEMIL